MLIVVWCPCLILKIQSDSGSSASCFVRRRKGSSHPPMEFLGNDKKNWGHEGPNILPRLARASHRDFQEYIQGRSYKLHFFNPSKGKSSGSRMRASVFGGQINHRRCLVRPLFQHRLHFSYWMWFRGLSQQDERERQRKTEGGLD